MTITVTNPETFYSGNTYCYANGSNFSGCPSGATQVSNVTNFNSALSGRIANNTRHLFRRGDTFSVNATYSNNSSGVTLGGYGSGARPRLTGSLGVGNVSHYIRTNDEWIVKDFEFIGGGGGRAFVARDGRQSYEADNSLVYDIVGSNVLSCIGSWENETYGSYGSFPTANAFVDIECNPAPVSSSGYGAGFHFGKKLMIMGYELIGNTGGSRVMRSVHLDRSVFQNNLIETTGNPQMTIRACGSGSRCAGIPDEYNVFSDNIFSIYNGGSNWMIFCNNNECDSGGGAGSPTRDHIVERNRYFVRNTVNPGTPFQRIIDIRGNNITIRNNIFDITNAVIPWGVTVANIQTLGATENGQTANHDNIQVYNNTIVKNDNGTSITLLNNPFSGATGHRVENNLIYSPGTSVSLSNGSNITTNGNLIYGTNYTTYPFSSPYSSPASMFGSSFAPLSNAPSVDAGVFVPTRIDYAKNNRPQGTAFDVGAFEYGSGGGPTGPYCGDGTCNGGESCSTCSGDCGVCAPQGLSLNFTGSAEGRTSLSSTSFTINIYNTGGSSSLLSFTNSGSTLALPSNTLSSGSYDVTITAPGYLTSRTTQSLSNSQTIMLPQLIAGDINNDNVINSLDWSVMSPQWFTSNPISDLNQDGTVNSIDFSFLNKNWGEVGG